MAYTDNEEAGTVLTLPDVQKPFVLQNDTSEVRLGVVLLQEHAGEEHPILYLSQNLFPRETRYSTIEKQALAIKWAKILPVREHIPADG